MMGIGSEFTVCSGGGTACCIGVRCGRKSRELLVSFKSGNIQVYNVRMQPEALVQPHLTSLTDAGS